jgi:ferredoxin
MCLAACPVYKKHPSLFLGPVGFVKLGNMHFNPVDKADRVQMAAQGGVQLCESYGACQEVCPQHIRIVPLLRLFQDQTAKRDLRDNRGLRAKSIDEMTNGFGPLGVMWSLVIVAIATMIFKWRRKAIFDASVASKVKLAGLSLHPIIGLLAIGTVLSMMYYYLGALNTQVLGGFAIPISEGFIVAFIIGIIGYYLAKFVQQKRGIPLELVFKQIPPE